MRAIGVWSAVVVASALLVGGAWWARTRADDGAAGSATAAAGRPTPVEVAPVQRRALQQRRTLTGTLEAAAAFVDGMRDMVVAAMVVGFARGIEVVLSDGQIMDTVVHSAAVALQQVPRHVAAVGMLVFQSTLNLLIPSGSGQAAVTMPLMAPLSDLLGLTRQTAVFAFTCGDGFSNSIIPTSGILMSMLALARIPYTTWLRFMVPLFLMLMGWSVVFLLVAVGIGYSG